MSALDEWDAFVAKTDDPDWFPACGPGYTAPEPMRFGDVGSCRVTYRGQTFENVILEPSEHDPRVALELRFDDAQLGRALAEATRATLEYQIHGTAQRDYGALPPRRVLHPWTRGGCLTQPSPTATIQSLWKGLACW